MKCKCGNELYKIEVRKDCLECNYNPAWDDDTRDYTNNPDTIADKGLDRDYAGNEGECEMGASFEHGCHMYTCSKCGSKNHLPLVDE